MSVMEAAGHYRRLLGGEVDKAPPPESWSAAAWSWLWSQISGAEHPPYGDARRYLELLLRHAAQQFQRMPPTDAASASGSSAAGSDSVGEAVSEHDSRAASQAGMGWSAVEAAWRELYAYLEDDPQLQGWLLASLAAWNHRPAKELLVDLLVDDPPTAPEAVSLALSPLFGGRGYVPHVFPRLLEAVAHPSAATAVWELANFATREGHLPKHPAAGRSAALRQLLEQMTARLTHWEVAAPASADTDVAAQVQEAVTLLVALCDAIGLVGDRQAIPALASAMELKHRRVRTEAAAALARLGDPAGQAVLLALAGEPIARLRVLAYAGELGLWEEVEPQWRTDAARAEAELALALAQPGQFGVPPVEMEVVDQREQFWPGYDQPVACFLIRFAYPMERGWYSNVGIVGPLTQVLSADLNDLPPDDIYAAYAGWQAEHEDIFEWEVAALPSGQQAELARLQRRLRDESFVRIEPQVLGMFFGQRVLAAWAEREGTRGAAVTDGQDCWWYPSGQARRPMTPAAAYAIYKGRKLLHAFN